ncbi:MAG: tRNA (adenosine(37)-N6)-threonylcarbamoyltransferase complex transferase subunit TsaD [Coriobacteriia bacterium]|nr:tRNA (adenosine(37)-N6)-threonylcarbamoyltransferase complex transferase subunit TsaD [Coriobacteriia bacterium]
MGKVLLSFDTAGDFLSVGIARYTGEPLNAHPFDILSSESFPAPRRANIMLLSKIDEALAELDLDRGDIAAVVVGRGPGSFTGVRIGVATAKGIARGLGVPLYGVSTTDAIAQRIAASGHEGWAFIAADAMRKEIYPALAYIEAGAVSRVRRDYVGKPEAVLPDAIDEYRRSSAGGTLLVAGNGLLKHRDSITSAFETAGIDYEMADESLGMVDGAGLIAAYVAAANGRSPEPFVDTGRPGDVFPIYTRMSDAEEIERVKKIAAGDSVPAYEKASDRSGVGILVGGDSLDAPAGDRALDSAFPVALRSLVPSDIEAMVAIEEALEHPEWTRGLIEAEFELINRIWVGAFLQGELVGFAGFADLAGDVHVLDVVTAPTARRKGVARKLILTGMQRALEWRTNKITLEVRVSNDSAIKLYESLGFVQAGVRPSYYSDNHEDALIMWGEMVTDEIAQTWWSSVSRQERAESGARILALESSCDETAAAVVEENTVMSNVIASQIDFHARFGGVVPEIASRKHIEAVTGVIDEALAATSASAFSMPLSALDALAVTDSPGLVGALVVGLAFMKGLSFGCAKPLYGINHLEGHIYANILAHPEIETPFVALLVSGGHTSLIHSSEPGFYRTLGETLDDATGEAFDKVAKALGLSYPGGPIISALAETGNPRAIAFPRAMMKSGDYAFSLSGLKTAVITHIHKAQETGEELAANDIAASFQQAVIDVQVSKSVRAVQETGAKWFLLAGGVAANKALREGLAQAMERLDVKVSVPPFVYCTDNAAMIARAAAARVFHDAPLDFTADASARASLDFPKI